MFLRERRDVHYGFITKKLLYTGVAKLQTHGSTLLLSTRRNGTNKGSETNIDLPVPVVSHHERDSKDVTRSRAVSVKVSTCIIWGAQSLDGDWFTIFQHCLVFCFILIWR